MLQSHKLFCVINRLMINKSVLFKIPQRTYLCNFMNLNISNLKNVQIRSIQSQGVVNKCWNCGEVRQAIDLFCVKCNCIQNPKETKNYFKVFNLKDDYDLDQKLLTMNYRKMQSVLHPDKFTNKSTQEKRISDEYSSLVNKAYNTLQMPLSRALHLLQINNSGISEEEQPSDPEFLMEIMELNEELEDAQTSDDLRSLDHKNKAMLAQISIDLSQHFKSLDIAKAKNGVIKMKYYHSLGKRINHLLREKGIVD